MSGSPPMGLSMTEKQKYRERLCAEVDGLRRQVEELRQHVQQSNHLQHEPRQHSHQQQLMAQYGKHKQTNKQQQNANEGFSIFGVIGVTRAPTIVIDF